MKWARQAKVRTMVELCMRKQYLMNITSEGKNVSLFQYGGASNAVLA